MAVLVRLVIRYRALVARAVRGSGTVTGLIETWVTHVVVSMVVAAMVVAAAAVVVVVVVPPSLLLPPPTVLRTPLSARRPMLLPLPQASRYLLVRFRKCLVMMMLVLLLVMLLLLLLLVVRNGRGSLFPAASSCGKCLWVCGGGRFKRPSNHNPPLLLPMVVVFRSRLLGGVTMGNVWRRGLLMVRRRGGVATFLLKEVIVLWSKACCVCWRFPFLRSQGLGRQFAPPTTATIGIGSFCIAMRAFVKKGALRKKFVGCVGPPRVALDLLRRHSRLDSSTTAAHLENGKESVFFFLIVFFFVVVVFKGVLSD
jgi:hypothetical protein